MSAPTPTKRVLFVRRFIPVLLVLFAVLSTLGLNLRTPRTASALTQNTINFQARLQNISGAIVPDGSYNVEFKLYSASSGGSALWTEDYYDSNGVTAGNDNRVTVANGYLTVSLGSQTAFPGTINWDQQLWLTMNVGGTTQTATPTYDGEMNPRLALTAVPYAFRAGQLAQFNSGTGFTSALNLAQPTVGNQTFQIPDQGIAGTFNVLTAPVGSDGYIKLQAATPGTQQTGHFNISGTGKADTFNATTALQTAGVTRVDASGNLTNIVDITGTGTLKLSGVGTSYLMGALGIGTTNPQAGAGMTLANGSWISSVDSAGTGYVNMFQVNSNNQIQVGAALNIDGGIVLPTNGGQLTFADLPIDATATAGTAESYTFRIGSSNVLTVYGEADGSGNLQNGRVAIGSSISPAYPLDVTGDINSSTGLRVGGTTVCTSTGCTAATGSGSYIQNTTSLQTTSNFWISGTGKADTALQAPTFQSAAATALTITGNAASTWSTSAGLLTINGAAGVSIDSSAAAQTISIGTSAVTHTIAIGNNAGAAQTITVGSTNTGSTTTIVGGGSSLAVANGGLTIAGNTTTSGTVSTTAGGAAGAGTQMLSSNLYIQSRGTGLVTNGSGLLGNNYNFPSQTFVQNDKPVGATGAFLTASTAGNNSITTTELIPVSPSRYYEYTSTAKQVAGQGNFYMDVAPYDSDNLSIQPYNYMVQANTNTTLAAPLNPGDTTMTLTSAANWNNAAGGVNTHLRSAIFWDWVDGKGYAWPAGTYSRYWSGSNFYADGAIVGNVITLNAPYAGVAHPAGTPVSNGSSGGSYMYVGAVNVALTSTWTTYTGRFGGGTLPAYSTQAASTTFPIATTSIKIGFLTNYNQSISPSQQSIANVQVSEVEAGYAAFTGPTSLHTYTLPNADATLLTTTSGIQLQGTTPGTQQTGNFNISGTGIAGVLQGGQFIAKPTSDSLATPSIQVQTSTGNNVFTVAADVNYAKIGFNLGANNLPSIAGNGMELQGSIRLTGGGGNYADAFLTPVGSSVGTKINVPIYDPGNFGQIIAFGLPSAANATSRAISLFDARTVVHQPTINVFSPDENQVFGLSWEGSNTKATLKTSGTDLTLQANSKNLLTATYLSSTTGRVMIGDAAAVQGSLSFANSTNMWGVLLTSGTPGADYTIQLPDALGSAGQCLAIAGVASTTETLGYTSCLTTTSGIQNQIASAQASSNFWISGTGNANLFQAPSFDTVTAGALAIGAANASSVTVTPPTTFSGTVTANAAISIQGTYTTTNNTRLSVVGTMNSSATSSQYGFQNQLNFNPTGASLNAIYGLTNLATVSGSALNINQVFGSITGIGTAAGYTGLISSGAGLVVSAPAIAGSQLITSYNGVTINANATNTGNTSGTISNSQIRVNGITAAAGSGGTINNYGINITIPSGAGAGTTNNYGLYIQGAGGGTANWSLYNASSAASYYAGNVLIGTTSNANNYALNLQGTAAASTSLLTPLLDTATGVPLNIGTSNATDINIGTNAANHTISIGSGAAVEAVTIGSTTGASNLTLQGGLGGITMNANNVVVNNGASNVLTIDATGKTTFKPVTDATDAFKVQNAAGTSTVLTADTTNSRVGIGTNAPTTTAHITVNGTSTTNPMALLEQTGTGDATLQIKTPAKSWLVGADAGDGSKFKISSSTASGSTTTFGKSSIGGTEDSTDQNSMECSKWTPDSTGTVTSMTVYAKGAIGSAPNNKFQVGIYTNGASKPDALVANSADGTLSAADTWNTVSISASVTSGTVYWLCVNNNATSNSLSNWAFDTGAAGSGYYINQAFGTWPSTYGTGTSVTQQFSMYATMTVSGPYDSFNAALFTLSDTGQVTLQNSTDSIGAFQIQNAAATSLFNVDTANTTVTVGAASQLDVFTKLANPASLPGNSGKATAFSPDGQYMSVAHFGSPYVAIYKRSGDTFTKLTVNAPDTLPAGHGNGTAFSPDGQYMSVAHVTTPFVSIYKRSGDTFTKLPDPSSLPNTTGQGTAFSPDGHYLTVTTSSSPYIAIYRRSGDTFTKLPNPATLPGGSVNGVAFSPDSSYMALALTGGGNVVIYKRSGDTFTKLADPGTLPTSYGRAVAFSGDGQYLTVAHDTSPYITIYKITKATNTFAKLANPGTLPGSNSYGVSFSPDSNYMSVVQSSSPYVTVYGVARSTDTFTKLADPGVPPAGTGSGVAWSPDGTYMSVAHTTTPFVTIYKHGTVTTVNGTLRANDGISAAGRVSGADAINGNEYATLGQLGTKISSDYGEFGAATVKSLTDSTSAFQVQNTASDALLLADTYNNALTLGSTTNLDTFTKLDDPAGLPAGSATATSFSADGKYMAVAHGTSPRITFYKRDGDTFTKLADVGTIPTGAPWDVDFSPDGTYVSVVHGTAPYLTLYKRSGDTFTVISGQPASAPALTAYGTDFSPDGNYLSVAHVSSPYITTYKRSGDTFTKLANPGTLPTSNASGVSYSPDGTYMSVVTSSTPFVYIYKRSNGGETYTKLADPASLPTGGAQDVAWSPDGTYMTVAHGTSPFITIYKRSGDTFTKLTNPGSLPPDTAWGVDFSHDGQYMSVAHSTSPFMTTYKITASTDTFTKIADPAVLPTDIGYGLEYSPNSQYLVIDQNASPYINIYKRGTTMAMSGSLQASSDIDIVGILRTDKITPLRSNDITISAPAGSVNITTSNTGYVALWNGVVSLNSNAPASSYLLNLSTSTTLGSSVNDALNLTLQGAPVGSGNKVGIGTMMYRTSAGTGWSNMSVNIGRYTDGSRQGSISFYGGGSVCINTWTCVNNFGVSGTIGASGSITASTTPDIAETIAAAPDVEAADVVMADPDNTERVVKTQTAYSSAAVGVISDGTSGFMINAHAHDESAPLNGKPLVLAGRVPVKVTNQGGAIKPGDYLTSSSTPGMAMKALRGGPTIGKSLGFFDGTTPTGTVLVMVSNSYYDPSMGQALQAASITADDINVSGTATIKTLHVTGDATIDGTLTAQNIIVNGHIVTGGTTAPTVTVFSNAGKDGVVTVTGNDSAGTITVKVGLDQSGYRLAAGDIAKLVFDKPFGKAPVVMLTPADATSAAVQVYPNGRVPEGFALSFVGTPQQSTTYTFQYLVVQ